MDHPEVSVIVPFRGEGPHLAPALESLSRQRGCSFEILLVDDGATGAARDMLTSYADRDPRFVLVPNHLGSGLVAALNSGIALARAALIARFDGDDLAHPERLARQVAHLRDHPDVALVACRFHLVTDGAPGGGYVRYRDWQNELLQHDDILRERFVESPLAHPTVCMRAKDLRALGGYRDLGWPEDYDLWLRLLESGRHVAKLADDLHGWRDHPGRHSRAHERYDVEAFRRLKAHFLLRGPLRTERPVFLWGAGPTGTRLWRALRREGARVEAFVDIDPKKIGSVRGGLPILSPEQLSATRAPFILAAVGGEGASVLEADLQRRGFGAVRDYLRVA